MQEEPLVTRPGGSRTRLAATGKHRALAHEGSSSFLFHPSRLLGSHLGPCLSVHGLTVRRDRSHADLSSLQSPPPTNAEGVQEGTNGDSEAQKLGWF